MLCVYWAVSASTWQSFEMIPSRLTHVLWPIGSTSSRHWDTFGRVGSRRGWGSHTCRLFEDWPRGLERPPRLLHTREWEGIQIRSRTDYVHLQNHVYPIQQTQNICITFVQCWTNVEDVGLTLYKCYTNVLCLLGIPDRLGQTLSRRWSASATLARRRFNAAPTYRFIRI